jgi:hypothetical protein
MKDDDDYNVWSDLFGYHDEDFDGDVDWEDADIEDQFFDELQEKFHHHHSPLYDEEDDDDDYEDEEWEDIGMYDDDEEDMLFMPTHHSSKVSSSPVATTADHATPVANVADNKVGTSEAKPSEQTKPESKSSGVVANNNATKQPDKKAETDDVDRLFNSICKWVAGILAVCTVIGIIFFMIGGDVCETIGTIFIIPPYIFLALCFVGAVLSSLNKK